MILMAKKQRSQMEQPKAPAEHTFQIRLPRAVYDEIERDARDNFRSVNLHIRWLIEERLKELRAKAIGS